MQIYAHRGASADFPEMTEAAFRGAVTQGADGFECDLRLSRDEVPVLWHNASMLERAGHSGLIAEMKYSEIKRAYPQVLTLDDFFDIAIETSKGVLIETKHPVISGNRIEEILAKRILDRKVLKKIELSVMSFSWGAIEKMHRLDDSIPTTFLMSAKTLWMQARFTSALRVAPGINEVRENPDLIGKIKKLGKSTAVWTVDSGSDIELCRDLGVDIVITNTPARARTFL
jgi:glycerophosphoryl diester phosphodiesterase